MKKILMVLFLINSFLFAQTDLIISEYVEGSGNNEAIEIYNGTSNPISLSGYSIGIYYNGQTSAGQTIVLTPSATIAAGDVYVVVYTGASLTLQAYADQLNGNTFNGNDALVLQNGSIVDVIGQVGFNPGAGWGSDPTSTVDHTLRRKTGITSGDTNPNDTFDPSVEWDGYAVDTFDGLGNSSPLPVELTSFSAAIKGNSIELKWKTATEVNNYGFELLRSKTISPASSNVDYATTAWTKIGFVAGAGNSNSPKEYSYIDNSKLDGTYQYRLKQIDIGGNYKYSDIVEVEINSVPNKFSLSQNYPNPFNPATVILIAFHLWQPRA